MMAYCKRSYTTTRRGKVHRSRRDKVFAGVCGGLAEHFDVSVNWLRIGFVVGSILAFPIPPLAYVLCIFLMPSAGMKKRVSHDEPPPIPTFHSSDDAMEHLGREFDEIEARIRGLEDHVTSREYVLKRKFDEL